jgi:inward rectifier potassium channel
MTKPGSSDSSPKAYGINAPLNPGRPVGSVTPNLYKIGVSRFDWRDPYHIALILSWRAFAGAVLACILSINAIFALFYVAVPSAVQNLPHRDFFMAFFFSLETLATVGYCEMAPNGLYGHTVAAAEIVTGMAFTAIMTGLVFIRFSRPRARFLFAENLVITSHNGRLTLCSGWPTAASTP